MKILPMSGDMCEFLTLKYLLGIQCENEELARTHTTQADSHAAHALGQNQNRSVLAQMHILGNGQEG